MYKPMSSHYVRRTSIGLIIHFHLCVLFIISNSLSGIGLWVLVSLPTGVHVKAVS